MPMEKQMKCEDCVCASPRYGVAEPDSPHARLTADERALLLGLAYSLQYDGDISDESALRGAALLRRIAGETAGFRSPDGEVPRG